MPRLDLMPDPVILPKWTANIILRLVTRDFHSLSEEERELLTALILLMILLIRSKFDPNDYDIIFRLLSNTNIILNIPNHLSSAVEPTHSENGDTSTSAPIVSGDLSQLRIPKKSKRTKSEKKAKPTKKISTSDANKQPSESISNEIPELSAEEYLPFTFD